MLHLKADLLGTLCPQAPRLQLTDKQANKQGPKKHQVLFAFRHKEKQYNRIGFTHQCLYIWPSLLHVFQNGPIPNPLHFVHLS